MSKLLNTRTLVLPFGMLEVKIRSDHYGVTVSFDIINILYILIRVNTKVSIFIFKIKRLPKYSRYYLRC